MARVKRTKPTIELIKEKKVQISETEMRLVALNKELQDLEAQFREEQIVELIQTVESKGFTLEEAIKHFAEKE